MGKSDIMAILRSGIGRRVQPGHLDVLALLRSGAITSRPRDGATASPAPFRLFPPKPLDGRDTRLGDGSVA